MFLIDDHVDTLFARYQYTLRLSNKKSENWYHFRRKHLRRSINVRRCAVLVLLQGTLCRLVEKNGRQFEADGAQAEAPAILYASCRCQEVSDVKWARPKTNILTARAGCVEARCCRPQQIVNASRSRELSLAFFIFVRFAKLPEGSHHSQVARKPWYHDIPPPGYIAYARHVFKAAKLPGKFIIAFIIGKTARSRPQTIYSRVKLNPQTR